MSDDLPDNWLIGCAEEVALSPPFSCILQRLNENGVGGMANLSEPVFIREATLESDDADTLNAWRERCIEESRSAGVCFIRISHHPEVKNRVVFEGWRKRPEPGTHGKPRFTEGE